MDYFLGQLLLVSFPFAPRGWALCNGQLLPVNQNQPLFSLIGTTFGGNGTTTFALPDLRGRIATGPASSNTPGLVAGTEQVTLTVQQIPAHLHSLSVSSVSGGALHTPVGNTVGVTAANAYASTASDVMDMGSISSVGGVPHENRSPYLTLNWIIALQGIFPTRS